MCVGRRVNFQSSKIYFWASGVVQQLALRGTPQTADNRLEGYEQALLIPYGVALTFSFVTHTCTNVISHGRS